MCDANACIQLSEIRAPLNRTSVLCGLISQHYIIIIASDVLSNAVIQRDCSEGPILRSTLLNILTSLLFACYSVQCSICI